MCPLPKPNTSPHAAPSQSVRQRDKTKTKRIFKVQKKARKYWGKGEGTKKKKIKKQPKR
jgi:hypothetical protein